MKKQSSRGNRFVKHYTRVYKFQQKRQLYGATKYLSFIPDDILYQATLYKVVTPEFQVFVHQQLRDLNFLLRLNKNDFFKQITQSDSLKLALESCLSTFISRKYSQFINTHKNTQIDPKQNETFIQYEALLKVLLTIYYRITTEISDQQDFQKIYNQWILDLPKILDLISIYGCCNSKILREIVERMFKVGRSYRKDFNDFLIILEENVILDIFEDLQHFKINLGQVQNACYHNIHKSLINSYIKILFSIYDCFVNLNYVYQYFPQQLSRDLAVDYGIQQRVIYIYAKLMMKIAQEWVLGKQIQETTRILIQGIKQQMVKYFIRTLGILKQVIDSSIQPFFLDGVKTLLCFGKVLLMGQRKTINKYYQNIFCILTKHLIKIFPTPSQIQHLKVDKNQKATLKIFSQLQNSVRLNSKQLDHIQKSAKIISQLPNFEDWKPQKCHNDDIMIQKPKQQVYFSNSKLHNTYMKAYDDQPQDQLQQFPRVRLLNEWQQYCLAPKVPKKNNLSVLIDKSIQTNHSQNLSFSAMSELSRLNISEISMIHQDRNEQMSVSSIHKKLINQFNSNNIFNSVHESKIQSSFLQNQQLSFDFNEQNKMDILGSSIVSKSLFGQSSIK